MSKFHLGAFGLLAAASVCQAHVAAEYGSLPMAFESNQGQIDASVKFLARGQGYGLFLTPDSAVLSLRANKPLLARNAMRPGDDLPAANAEAKTSADETTSSGIVVRMNLVGASAHARVSGLNELSGTSNYFMGNDPSHWRTHVPGYSKVEYAGVYPGVDLVYYGNQRQLEYDFIVAPGADPNAIALDFQGVRALHVNEEGDLILATTGGDLVQHKPVIYQDIDGRRRRVEGGYVVSGQRARFQVARYDRKHALVIDPTLAYSTYLGGSDYDSGYGIAVDASGKAYVTGYTYSTDFPATSGDQAVGGNGDAFVAELNAAGTALVYSTYLGGSSQDLAYGIAVDAGGNAYVTGYTRSADFPTTTGAVQRTFTAGAIQNAFVARLDASGELAYSTYLGGSSSDVGQGIAVDMSGAAFVTGYTSSSDFPVTTGAFQPGLNGLQNAFVAKLDSQGSALTYSTFLGGDDYDFGYAIAIDGNGNAYVAGTTYSIFSSTFPTTAGAFQIANAGSGDAFVSKLSADGSRLVYSTFLGGAGYDGARGIAIDASGAAYVTGYTLSAAFPTTVGAAQTILAGSEDAFVAKLDSTGAELAYSTYLGGSGFDAAYGIAVGSSGNAYVTGYTQSIDFPTSPGALQTIYSGSRVPFLTELDPAGATWAYSSYLGGSGGDGGYALAVDASGNAYVTGYTGSADFPATADSYQAALGAGAVQNAFVAKVAFAPVVASYTVTASAPGGNGTISPASVTVIAGDTASFTLTPANGYRIDSVSGCGGTLNGTAYTTAPVQMECAVTAVFTATTVPPAGQMRITEYMYKGNGGEFVEFTNVGNAPVDMTRWSFSDGAESPGETDLSSYGTVAPGESVILTESPADSFRTEWNLCDAVKVIGNNTHNLGREDEINLYDQNGGLVDRLAYGDDTIGGPRAQNPSAYVSAAGLGANDIHDWTLSAVGDGEGSYASSAGDVGSPGKSTRATVAFNACAPAVGVMRITEYMYKGSDGEFIEFTNIGNAAVDMTGWSFDDHAATPGAVDLSSYGSIAAGESVILTETAADAFRTDWNLCGGIKIVGSNTHNLGREDQINLYDASGTLVDRLTYGDDTIGGPRAQSPSAWVDAAGLGNDIAAAWTLSALNDSEGSTVSSGGDIGSPGKSTRATVVYDSCTSSPGAPVVQVDPAATSIYIDLPQAGPGYLSGVIGDPSDPAAMQGIGFTFALPGGGDPSTLTITATSSNAAVVDSTINGLDLNGSDATRHLTITPIGVGYTTITISATDANHNTGTYVITYAASAGVTQNIGTTSFHTGASDGSATVAIDADYMFVGDDEINVLQLYSRDQSGMPVAGFDFSSQLNLTDPDNPEIDIEGSTRTGNRLFWTGSYGNSKNFHVRPNRHRVFATDLAGTGAGATLSYAGRYDWLLEDMVAWDENNGHGLGANYLGFAASSAEGVDSKTPAGFNIEGLGMAPDNTTAYFGFRAPQLPTTVRHLALIVPVLNFDTLVTAAAPGSAVQGSAEFGAPILFDLGGRGIRSIDRNAAGQYLITAGPAGDDSGIAPDDFRLYAWTGNPADAPVDLGVDLTALQVAGGAFESIAQVPDQLGPNTDLEFVLDNGDSVWYGDGAAAKDLTNLPLRKFTSVHATVNIQYPASAMAAIAGTPQTSVVGQAFASPLMVKVTDAYGNPVGGVAVTFAAPATGATATLSSNAATTSIDGTASVTAIASASVGSYAVTATAVGIAAPVGFTLTNTVGAPAAIMATGGTPQSAVANQAFASPLVVHVADAGGNAIAGVSVAFASPASGASAALSTTTATTDGSGNASVTATANASIGSYSVNASVSGVAASASFALTNTVGAPAAIGATGGTPQSTAVNHTFAVPLAVRVTDAGGNAIAGVTVTFATPDGGAGAVLSAMKATTDASGNAQVTATANGNAGSYSVTASVAGIGAPASFALTNTIDAADVIFRDGFELPAR